MNIGRLEELRAQLEEIGGLRIDFYDDNEMEPGTLLLCWCSTDAANTDAHDLILTFKVRDAATLISCRDLHRHHAVDNCSAKEIASFTGTWEGLVAYFREVMTTKVAPLA